MTYKRVRNDIEKALGVSASNCMKFNEALQFVFFSNRGSNLFIQISRYSTNRYELRICDLEIQYIYASTYKSFKACLEYVKEEYESRFFKAHFKAGWGYVAK